LESAAKLYKWSEVIKVLKSLPLYVELSLPCEHAALSALIEERPLCRWLAGLALIDISVSASGLSKGIIHYHLTPVGAIFSSEKPALQKLSDILTICGHLKPDKEYFILLVQSCELSELPQFLTSDNPLVREAAKERLDALV